MTHDKDAEIARLRAEVETWKARAFAMFWRRVRGGKQMSEQKRGGLSADDIFTLQAAVENLRGGGSSERVEAAWRIASKLEQMAKRAQELPPETYSEILGRNLTAAELETVEKIITAPKLSAERDGARVVAEGFTLEYRDGAWRDSTGRTWRVALGDSALSPAPDMDLERPK
jgi:hypothetical protein